MKTQGTGTLQKLLVPGLCAVFFILALALALMGSSTYTRTVNSSDANTIQRISLSYIANQVRHGDTAEAMAVGTFGGYDAIAIYEGDYVTYIYCMNGYLRELFTDIDSGLLPGDGMEIAALESLTISIEDGGMLLNADGKTLFLTPRCGLEGGVVF